MRDLRGDEGCWQIHNAPVQRWAAQWTVRCNRLLGLWSERVGIQ